jgi:hypothetical protein
MKKKSLVLKTLVCCWMLLFAAMPVQAQKPVKITDKEQIKAFDNNKAVASNMDTRSASEKQKVKKKALALKTYFVKAILNKTDKAKYPMDKKLEPVEEMVAKFVDRIPAGRFQKASDKAKLIAVDKNKAYAELGEYNDVDFSRAGTHDQIRKKGDFTFSKVKFEMPKLAAGYVDILLHRLHCLDETDPENNDDDMIVGGIIMGAGYSAVANPVFCGSFDDGDMANMNNYQWGRIVLGNKNFPQDYMLAIVMAEIDEDENEATDMLKDCLEIVCAALDESGSAEMLLASLDDYIEAISGFYFDQDLFPAYNLKIGLKGSGDLYINDVKRTLTNEKMTQDLMVTGQIKAHNGTYRAGYNFKVAIR